MKSVAQATAPAPSTEAIPANAITRGDAAAADAAWPAAIAAWESALHGPHHHQAVTRIQWFLRNGQAPPPARSSRRPVLLAALILALVGTSLIFIAQTTAGPLANALAIAAWACYIATAIGAIVYAWRSGNASPGPDIDASALECARHHAQLLEAGREPAAPNMRR